MVVPVRYFVVRCDGQWRVEFQDKYRNGFRAQKEAISFALDMAQKKAAAGHRVEVLIQGSDKIWRTKWSSRDS